MKYANAQVVETRDDFFPVPRLIRYNGRYYTAFGRLFAVRGNHMDCDMEEYERLCHEEPWYQFTDWDALGGMYKE